MIRKFSLVVAVLFAAVFFADCALAGQLPSRIKEIKVGDWIFYNENDEFIKETVTGTEKVEDDFVVTYTREKFSADGKVAEKDDLARLLTGEQEELAEYAKEKIERRRVNLGGKTVNVLVINHGGPAPYQTWYSPEIGVTGSVAMVYSLPTGEDGKPEEVRPIDTLGWGDAKTRFDFKRLAK